MMYIYINTCTSCSYIHIKYNYKYMYMYTHQYIHYMYTDVIKFTYYPLTTVYFVIEVHCTLNVLHSITP